MQNKKAHDLAEGHGNVKDLIEFFDADKAVKHIKEIYNKNVTLIRETFLNIAKTKQMPQKLPNLSKATYPYLGVKVPLKNLNIDHRVAFGAVLEAGTYGTTLTRPDLFDAYYSKQIDLLIHHHKIPVVVGKSDWPIPLPFVDEWDSETFQSEKEKLIKDFYPA